VGGQKASERRKIDWGGCVWAIFRRSLACGVGNAVFLRWQKGRRGWESKSIIG